MCDLCPRKCNADRENNVLGYCKMPSSMAVAKIMMYKWEEPFISGIEYGAKGTGAIFFYGCNLSCVYCQNYKISNAYKKTYTVGDALDRTVGDALDRTVGDALYASHDNALHASRNVAGDALDKTIGNALDKTVGDALYASHACANKYKIYTADELSDEMLKLQNNGAYTISLITPNIYIDEVVKTIKLAKEKGVNIPFVYNTSGYDSIESLKKLDGLIDIYMPDFKYYDDELGKKYSDVDNYVEVTKKAIAEMYRQLSVGDASNNTVGDALHASRKLLLVRHLVLPGHVDDSKNIIKYLYDTYGDNIYISIMNQYTPPKDMDDGIKDLKNKNLLTTDIDNLSRHLTKKEYDEVVNYAIDLGISNAFIQDEGTDSTSFIPEFL